MWLFTVHGFYSLVAKDGGYHLRARVKQDLANIKRLTRVKAEVVKSFEGSDYPWRMILTEAEKEVIMRKLSDSIDYGNFKGAVGQRADQAVKLPAYHRVWATMASLSSDAG